MMFACGSGYMAISLSPSHQTTLKKDRCVLYLNELFKSFLNSYRPYYMKKKWVQQCPSKVFLVDTSLESQTFV